MNKKQQEKLEKLISNWREEMLRTTVDGQLMEYNNKYYKKIIDLGPGIIPYICKILLNNPPDTVSYFHFILKGITGENPIQEIPSVSVVIDDGNNKLQEEIDRLQSKITKSQATHIWIDKCSEMGLYNEVEEFRKENPELMNWASKTTNNMANSIIRVYNMLVWYGREPNDRTWQLACVYAISRAANNLKTASAVIGEFSDEEYSIMDSFIENPRENIESVNAL